jgi:hypothetical protein
MNKADEAVKNIVLGTARLLADIDTLNGISQGEKDRLNDLASQVVGLRDTNKFNITINIDKEDIRRLRRDLASAISAEKFVSGFMTAIQLLAAVGAI